MGPSRFSRFFALVIGVPCAGSSLPGCAGTSSDDRVGPLTTLVVPEPAVSRVAVVEVTAAPIPIPVAPAVTEASELAHARAQARALGGVRLPALQAVPRDLPRRPAALYVGLSTPTEDLDEQPETVALDRVVPEASTSAAEVRVPGFFVPIDDPLGGPALASFHSALQTLAEGRDPDGKVRVAMYGASGTAADISVGYLRTYLQSRFGDGGPGFVPLAPLSNGYRHSEVVVKASKGWKKETASRGRQDGLYGLLGASFTATAARRKSQVTPKDGSTSSQGIAHAEVFFLRQPRGGSFSLVIDDGPPQVVRTAGEAFEPGYHVVELEPGPHGFRVETIDRAEVRVFGIVLERRDPGVVVDVLGINGARGASHIEWNEALWADNLRRRAPDLYTLSYGTNESVDASLSIPRYAEGVREQLRRFRRALPEASCVLLGPVDFPMIKAGHVRPRPVLRKIVEVQRQVAAEEGCGFWDGMAFMGGELSMPTWVNADPPLARKDHLHYTRRGGARKGMALADALMLGFDAPGSSLGSEGQALLPVPR
jgi:hypothetical protein